MQTLKLASNFRVPATEYASQANAVLGIRDSGKTYSAMKVAEGLLDAGIPVIVYDPVGVWKNLRVGINGHKGYPVLVAGGDDTADILLTTENAVDIVRAAMKAGVSLVLDLFSPSLANKSKWVRIVQETVDVLMYENKPYGLRHVFLEEAAEFIPQRLQPQQAKVYGSIERLARMGRNAGVGMTIINQRAEEVNKAILELCAISFLHKQVGKNSLLSLGKWLFVMGVEHPNFITSNITRMEKGECFIISSDGHAGHVLKSKILPKHTYHPSPEKGLPVKAMESTINIGEFVKKLNAQLAVKDDKPSKTISSKSKQPATPSPSITAASILAETKNRDRVIVSLKKENEALTQALADRDSLLADFLNDATYIKDMQQLISKMTLAATTQQKRVRALKTITASKIEIPVVVNNKPTPASLITPTVLPATINLSAKQRMLKAIAMWTPSGISKARLSIIAGMSQSGTFQNYYGELRKEGMITYDNYLFSATNEGIAWAKTAPDLPNTTAHGHAGS